MAKVFQQKKGLEGYLYILPAFLLVTIFGLYPIFYTVFVSLHRWRIKRGNFIGFDNYTRVFGEGPWVFFIVGALILLIGSILLREQATKRFQNRSQLLSSNRFSAMSQNERWLMIGHYVSLIAALVITAFTLPQLWETGDDRFFDSFRITIWYSIGAVPVQLAGGLFIAWFLNNKFKGRQVYRVLVLLPYIVPTVAGAAVFERLFSLRPESFANQVLMAFGGEPQEWLIESRGLFELIFGVGQSESGKLIADYWTQWASGPSLALVAILFFNYWVFTGYYALIYSNGLSQIPKELYEAAEVDGAPKRTVFFRIVLPLLSPTTFFLSLLGIIGTFKSFSHIWVLRNPVAGPVADPMSIYIFNVFYTRSLFGYASALSLVLLVIVLLLTLFQNRMMRNRIHYGD